MRRYGYYPLNRSGMNSEIMNTTCTVELAQRAYPIVIGTGLLDQAGTHVRACGISGRVLVVSDETVHPLYGARLRDALEREELGVTELTVPVGESSKCHTQLLRIYDAALAAGLERASTIIALGGGVVGDLAGYAAATYLRGIRYVQVPTSLLAMVDSAVGGKTGVNLPQGKNLIGAFHQPTAVLADLSVLETLSPREFAAGLAEVIKYGVIVDPDVLSLLEQADPDALQRQPDTLRDVVQRSCAIKAEVVRRDEREGGLRAILNFGHTLGHALEQVCGYGEWLHGEAIAIGMVYAARLSQRVHGFSTAESERLIAVLQRHRLPVHAPAVSWPALLEALQRDKKKKAGTVGFVLARALGQVDYGCAVAETDLHAVWEEDMPRS